MATISLGIRNTKPLVDGSFTIFIFVCSQSRTAYIPTRFRVANARQWKDGRIYRHPDAEVNNRKLHKLLKEYEDAFDAMPNKNVSAIEMRDYLISCVGKSKTIKEFGEEYIARLEKEGRKSYAANMGYTIKYLIDRFGESMELREFTPATLTMYEDYLREEGNSDTTINIRMSHLKVLLNAAVSGGNVEYRVFPFRGYKMPQKAIRDICISKAELSKLRETEFSGTSAKRLTVARDLFMLSFYCAGINLIDLMDATLTDNVLTFIRKKTAAKKRGTDIEVSITIQPEAREIIERYIADDGHLDFGYNYAQYEQFRSFVTKSLNRIGEELGFEKKLMFYSARKTFVQFGTEIGIPLYILEYAIGQTIKDANNRPIFNYLKVMRQQADLAIRTIIDYTFEPEQDDTAIPIPEWARRRH